MTLYSSRKKLKSKRKNHLRCLLSFRFFGFCLACSLVFLALLQRRVLHQVDEGLSLNRKEGRSPSNHLKQTQKSSSSLTDDSSSTDAAIARLENLAQLPIDEFRATRSCPDGTISYPPYYTPPKEQQQHKVNPNRDFLLLESRNAEYTETRGNHRISRLAHKTNLSHEETKQRITQLLHYTITQLQAWNIPYQLFFGTLLGAYRHLNFIPWDNDSDLLILEQHVQTLRGILLSIGATSGNNNQEQHQSDPNIIDHDNKYQWIITAGKDARTIAVRVAELETGLYVDLFQLTPSAKNHEQMYEIQGLFGCFPHAALFPSQNCVFGDFVYTCPKSPKATLILTYSRGLGIPTDNLKLLPEGHLLYEGVVSHHDDIPNAPTVKATTGSKTLIYQDNEKK